MVFATSALARRIEDAEQSMVAEVARVLSRRPGGGSVFLTALGGGAAVFAGDNSPYNKIAGLGFAPLDEGDLQAVERELAARGCPVQVELSTLADPEIGERLTQRGYVLRGFENVLAMTPSGGLGSLRWSAGISVAAADDSAAWIEVVTTGFVHPDVYDGPASHEAFSPEMLRQVFHDTSEVASFDRFIATRDGSPAGGASLRIWKGVAQFCGAATLPEHRRHGVQTALLRHRLAAAAAAGCDIAVVTTGPGSRSQENVQRQGFSLIYARAVLVKPAP